MNFHLSLKKKKTLKKKLHVELSPRHYWVILLTVFISVLVLELGYFTWLFWKTNENIDAPATPILETNAPKIHSMERSLNTVEEAIRVRRGGVAPSSQTSASVVQ